MAMLYEQYGGLHFHSDSLLPSHVSTKPGSLYFFSQLLSCEPLSGDQSAIVTE